MGFLYLDESGNTGVKDTNQSKLIFGGPYVPDIKRDSLVIDLRCILNSYKCTIRNRIGTINLSNENDLANTLYFLRDFEMHAVDMMSRTGLWSKLTFEEIVEFLSEILNLIIKHDITFYASILDKSSYPKAFYKIKSYSFK